MCLRALQLICGGFDLILRSRATRGCRRARGRQGWPGSAEQVERLRCRPSLTAAARAGFWIKRPGRKNAPRGPNQRMESKGMTRVVPARRQRAPTTTASRFPFRHAVESTGTGSGKCCGSWAVLGRRSSAGEAISVVRFDDAAGVGEHGEPLIERGGADATAGTQIGERKRRVGTGECGCDALVERAWRRRCRIAPVDDLQCKCGPTLCQLDGDGGQPSRRR